MAGRRKLFVNLGVADLARSVAFFGALGFRVDPRLSDGTAACIPIGGDAAVMLLGRQRLAELTGKRPCDPRTEIEALLCVSAESRAQVEEMVVTAIAAGGAPAEQPKDHGFMYAWSFRDPDGHSWEVMWIDEAAITRAQPETVAAR